QHLWDGRVFMRRNAALVSRMRQVPTDWTLLLSVATKDTDPMVRENALLALGRVDGPLDDALPALLRGLTDRAENVRVAARDSLFNLAASRRVEMTPHLIRGLMAAPPAVAVVAADLLAAPEAADALVEALVHPARAIRELAVGVLVRIGEAGATALLRALGDPARRTLAAQVLIQLAPLEAGALAELDRPPASPGPAPRQLA